MLDAGYDADRVWNTIDDSLSCRLEAEAGEVPEPQKGRIQNL